MATAGMGKPAPDTRCVECHGDNKLTASDGRSVYVDARKLAASLHGKAGLGCVDCHADLKGADDFPHPKKLKPANCWVCHDKPTAEVIGSVHRPGQGGAAGRVPECWDCHGSHDIRPANDPLSSVNPANLARTCGKCHAGAGANFSRGKIHLVSLRVSNPGAHAVRVFYIILIAVVVSGLLSFVFADILRYVRLR